MSDWFYGDFDHIPDAVVPEGAVRVVVQPIDLMTHWRRCGLLADFAAAFCSYPGGPRSPRHEELVSTVFNELIENAAKFSRRRDAVVLIDVKRYHRVIKIEVGNRCDAARLDGFRRFLSTLAARGDVEASYFDRLAKRSAADRGGSGDGESGIGLLMLLKDYPVKIGVRIAPAERGAAAGGAEPDSPGGATRAPGGDVTVQVYCFLPGGAEDGGGEAREGST